MKYLFKIIPDPAPSKPQVGDTNFKSFYQQVNKGMLWEVFLPDVRRVTRDIIVPWVTPEFYKDLSERYHTDESNLNEEEKEILELLQDAISFYVVWKISPRHNVTIGDLGIQEQNSSDGSTPAASQWRYKNFHWNIMKEADVLMDNVLTYLEVNQEKFSKFKSNKAKLAINDSYIRHTADFQQFIFIHDSRRTFIKLQPSIRKAQDKIITPILGAEFHKELLDEVKEGTVSDANKKVLRWVQEVMAHQALHYGLPHLAVVIESDGIKIVSSTDGMNTRQTAHESRLEALRDQNENDLQQSLQGLINFLYCNESDYPTWKNSDAYQNFNQKEGGYPLIFEGGGGVVLD